MKKSISLAVAALALAAVSAHACSLESRRAAGSAVDKALTTRGWNLPPDRFDAICRKLQQANAVVVINSSALVLQGKSIGWVALGLADKRTGFSTLSFGQHSTHIDARASQNVADDLAYAALNDALAEWDIDAAIGALRAERQAMKSR